MGCYKICKSSKNNRDCISNLQKEEHHLTSVVRQNRYPSVFVRSSSKPHRQDMEATETAPQEEEHRPLLVMLPYTEGVSEYVRWVCRKFGMKVVSGLDSPSAPC